jgi:hypothetical protein
MPHLTSQTVESTKELFDANNPEYADVREHFSAAELEQIDRIAAYPPEHHYTLGDRLVWSYALGKAVMTSTNAGD